LTDYVLSLRGSPDVERTRLRLLEEYHDPLTASQLDAIGVGAGWRCLDAGAGGGSVTRMLVDRVGSTGSVLAVDLDTTLLKGLASDRVEVRRHDLLSDGLPESEFDLVHARLLLMFLSPRLEALDRLVPDLRGHPRAWPARHRGDDRALL
jgi:trans-aconitate methyltransferase